MFINSYSPPTIEAKLKQASILSTFLSLFALLFVGICDFVFFIFWGFFDFCDFFEICFKMGFSLCTCSNPRESPLALDHHHRQYNEVKIRTLLRKMIWERGFACILPPACFRRKNQGIQDDEHPNVEGKNENLEHNKAWLLAESGACGGELFNSDPQSVHSSFRFSFCSQIELETMNIASSTPPATVLMVNLDNGMMAEALNKELKWRRIESLEKSISPVAHTLIRFSFREILSATRNFSTGRVLGRGALSCVFRGRVGFLRTSVAIKRLDKEDKESTKAFCRELMIASSLQNPFIVPLVGFCIDPEEGLFLVYKYVSGGSLERHLHDKKKRGMRGCLSLPWSVRFKIGIGIAEAVAYLHNGTERCVVHRDIKPSNILLSSKKMPKLCDFGLATWTSAPFVPFLCKTVKGTFGYLAPEYFQHGKVSDKTDVYALGVVLLELITGRKPIEARTHGEENLVLWAKPLLQKGKAAITELLDPLVACTTKNSNQIIQMIEAAAACITSEESRRPGILEIIAILKGEEQPMPSRSKRSGFLGHGCVTDSYSQFQNTNSEMMTGHLALAMAGLTEFEQDDYLFCR
ncbi:probable serine/threonine-protein kinase PBL7 [Cucurbita maxima]|uniref:Probable serine/threonine-protein kinase PBL7 n=1 Tax=Cucurbita maxima TaxID=3661 RepID=A0A6J1JPE4_CUCMA|nr:probable serine/threonine-protein kinase PBL7 [Cucurbita maxima]